MLTRRFAQLHLLQVQILQIGQRLQRLGVHEDAVGAVYIDGHEPFEARKVNRTKVHRRRVRGHDQLQSLKFISYTNKTH